MKHVVPHSQEDAGSRTLLGRDVKTGQRVVLKTWSRKYWQGYGIEYMALQELRGRPGVVQFLDRFFDDVQRRSGLVLEYVEGTASRLADMMQMLLPQLQSYFRQLIQVILPGL
jgi:serine/threonine protein kinase